MFKKILATLGTNSSNDSVETRRKQPRRQSDRCVAVIHGQAFPVEDWSPDGLLISADDRMFGLGQGIEFTVKFKLRDTVIDIKHSGQIIRKANQKVALQFAPLTQTIRRGFQQVIDDQVAREFANSQAV